jgi:mRNA interferase HicA
MKRKEFERHLKNNGCELLREGSNHSIWVNKLNDIQTSVPRHPEIVNITCKIICKQLSIPVPVKS